MDIRPAASVVIVFALLDRKLREFGKQLFLDKNVESLERGLLDSVLSNEGAGSFLAKYPEDYDLYCLGEMDMETGYLTPAEPPRLVSNFGELVAKRRAVMAPPESLAVGL